MATTTAAATIRQSLFGSEVESAPIPFPAVSVKGAFSDILVTLSFSASPVGSAYHDFMTSSIDFR